MSNAVRFSMLALAVSSLYSPLVWSQADENDLEVIEIKYRQAYRGDTPMAEIPQAITVLDRTLIEDVQLSRFRDILTFDPSIALQNDGGNLWDSYSLRGFPGNENVPTGYLVNGFAAGRGFGGYRDSSNIELVEVLKGPGSALYGRSDPGGIINVVTKKPQYATEGYLQTTVGTDDRYRLEGDYTSAVNDAIAFRINGAVQEFGSFRDFVSTDKRVVNPSVRWQVTPDTSLLYSFDFQKQEQLFDRGIVVLDNDIRTVPRERYLGEPNDGPTRIIGRGHQLTFEHYLQNDWYMTGGISYRTSKLDGYSSDAELSKSRQQLLEDGETLTRQRRRRDYDSEDLSARFELSGNLAIGGLTHHVLMGVDAYTYDLFTLLARQRITDGSYTLDINDPAYGQVAPEPPTMYANDENQKGFGVYLQDQIDIATDWRLLLGLRYDDYSQETNELVSVAFTQSSDSRVSPRIALSYLPFDELTLYSSYSEGFVPISGTDYQGRGFDPEESDSIELGFKWRARGFTLNGALFDASKTNILTTDPEHPGYPAALGAASSRGIELDLTTDLGRYTYLRLAYSFLDTQTENSVVNYDWGLLVPAGSDLVNVPRHTVNLFIKHELSHWGLDASVGARARYVDDRLGDTVDPSYRLPAYQVLDVFYTHQVNSRTEIQLNIDNVFDEYYLSNAYSALWTTPGAPRQLSVNLKYEF